MMTIETKEELIKEIEAGAYSYKDVGEAFLEYFDDEAVEKLCYAACFRNQDQEDQIETVIQISKNGLAK
tara:strand:- start:1319 stop:1525 length:207 start_codon:yes stop_codon:yes gene_type:complete